MNILKEKISVLSMHKACCIVYDWKKGKQWIIFRVVSSKYSMIPIKPHVLKLLVKHSKCSDLNLKPVPSWFVNHI